MLMFAIHHFARKACMHICFRTQSGIQLCAGTPAVHPSVYGKPHSQKVAVAAKTALQDHAATIPLHVESA